MVAAMRTFKTFVLAARRYEFDPLRTLAGYSANWPIAAILRCARSERTCQTQNTAFIKIVDRHCQLDLS